jgi:hypothetical protein
MVLSAASFLSAPDLNSARYLQNHQEKSGTNINTADHKYNHQSSPMENSTATPSYKQTFKLEPHSYSNHINKFINSNFSMHH